MLEESSIYSENNTIKEMTVDGESLPPVRRWVDGSERLNLLDPPQRRQVQHALRLFDKKK